MLFNLKRVGIGYFVMIVVSIGLAFLPELFPFAPAHDQFFLSQPLPTIEQSLKMVVAAFAGAYVARVPFVLPAILYYVAATSYVFYVLVLIAEPAGPVSYVEIAARNSIGAGVGLIATALGAHLGFKASESRTESVVEAV